MNEVTWSGFHILEKKKITFFFESQKWGLLEEYLPFLLIKYAGIFQKNLTKEEDTAKDRVSL